MVTVLRADGLRVVIYANDHPPAHVHVVVAGRGEAKINLVGGGGGGDRVELLWADGMARAEVRRAVRLVAEQRAVLLARWEEIHERRAR